MAIDVLMPQLGETVAEGTVAQWHKQVGDRVEADEVLLDVETDKVSMEIPAPQAGVLKSILVQEGQTVDVGTVLAVIESGAADAAAPSQGAAPAQASTPPPAEAQASTGTAAMQMAGAVAGAMAQPEPAAAAAAASTAPPSSIPRSTDTQKRLSPAVRRLVAEHDLDIQIIPGTGRDGRITRKDVLAFLSESPGAARAAAAAPQPTQPPAAAGSSVQPFNRIRRLTAEHMVRSKATSPHVLQAVEVDFSNIDRVRGPAREAWRAKQGFSLTYMPFIARAVCRALKEFPNVNASVEENALRLHTQVNLAIAVDLGPEGLVAPVVKNAERLSVTELARAINDLSTRARANRLGPDDLSGGTYTLSNSGSFGTLITAPVINQPQVAILSIDGIRKKPVVVELPEGDVIAIRPVGVLAQSFDHRAIDGAYSAAFLGRIRTLLEQDEWSVEA
jgi:pyruvate dehydrogenase E2 component (dihydrolipoamide acetyltransferase)